MDKSNTIVSPVTKGPVKLLFQIQKSTIIDSYMKESQIDVSYLFENTEMVSVYECTDTSYRFFHPFTIDGDGPFYEKLELIPWYYADWKWDYEVAKNWIEDSSKVLDIGCGEAKFLAYLQKSKQCVCTGLELNEKAKNIAVNKGLDVSNELIQDHVKKHENAYDIVTFFQVLEHISAVDSFLKSAISVVKPGGKIILAVPNNEPYYLTFDKFHFLNLPPHHMGWWNTKSLTALAEIYGLNLLDITKQPLEHYTSYTNSFLDEKLPKLKFLKPLLFPICKVLFYLNRKNINGASILAVYSKPL